MLYGIAFTIKMSYKGAHKIEGFFEYVVPPLEGLWWQENTQGLDYARKEDMHFISMIRLPDFVTKEDFAWAVQEAGKKKKQDIYLSDPRRCGVSRLKTVVRHPIRRAE